MAPRRLFLALLFVLAACTSAPSATKPGAAPLWRNDTSHLGADRALVRTCLTRANAGGATESCRSVVQAECMGAVAEDGRVPAVERRCDWRAIAAWEDEMAVTLSALRTKLGPSSIAELNASQKAWEASMLADVALNMDLYAGGSLSGPMGARVRADAVASRVIFLEEFRSRVESP